VLAPCELILEHCKLEKCTMYCKKKRIKNAKKNARAKHNAKKNMHITNARKMQVQKRNSQIFAIVMHFPGFCNFFSKIMFV
jgi:hypothetical protein